MHKPKSYKNLSSSEITETEILMSFLFELFFQDYERTVLKIQIVYIDNFTQYKS